MTDLDLKPAFIVGTGRCGSTMLSVILRDHPRLLSLSETFSFVTDLGGRIAETFPDDPIDAAAFWRLIGDPHPKQTVMLRHGVAMDEALYHPGPDTRFSAESGVPAIAQTTLPHLSAAPDLLLDEVREFVAAQPAGPATNWYTRLFDHLARRFGKAGWVERSGGSLRIVHRLARAFPDARFIHLVRDGRDCAISMSRHYGFRMVLLAMQLTEILGVDPYESPDRTWEHDIPDDLVHFLPERFDAEEFRRYETPLPLCGYYWAGEIVAGLAELAEIPAERRLTLRYEDFLARPQVSIARMLDFLDAGGADAPWVDRAAATIRRARSSFRDLPPRTLAQLTDACAPGFAALGDLYADAV
jgi:putative sulfotransferase